MKGSHNEELGSHNEGLGSHNVPWDWSCVSVDLCVSLTAQANVFSGFMSPRSAPMQEYQIPLFCLQSCIFLFAYFVCDCILVFCVSFFNPFKLRDFPMKCFGVRGSIGYSSEFLPIH